MDKKKNGANASKPPRMSFSLTEELNNDILDFQKWKKKNGDHVPSKVSIVETLLEESRASLQARTGELKSEVAEKLREEAKKIENS